jgi:hypothetical protein
MKSGRSLVVLDGIVRGFFVRKAARWKKLSQLFDWPLRCYGGSGNALGPALIGAILAGCAGIAANCPVTPAPVPAPPFRVSLSVSPFTELTLKSGVVFTDGERVARTTEELQALYISRGANEVYARIATARTYGTKGIDRGLAKGLDRARLAHRLGLPFNPELGLFGTYGDIRCQGPPDFSEYPEIRLPGPWSSLTLDQMEAALHTYGAVVARTILETGVEVRIWDLGNEVEFGIAGVSVRPASTGCPSPSDWKNGYEPPDRVDPEIGKMSVEELARMTPSDRIRWLQKHIWPYVARILAAVASGIRSVDPNARFSTHVSGGAALNASESLAFYGTLKDGGFVPDEFGFSYYPSNTDQGDRLRDFANTLMLVKCKFNRPVFIAEFGYPVKTIATGDFQYWNHPLAGYSITEEGQAELFHDLASWGAAVGVSGIRPFAPDLLVPGWEPMALFSLDVTQLGPTAISRPALGAFGKGAAAPDSNALQLYPRCFPAEDRS